MHNTSTPTDNPVPRRRCGLNPANLLLAVHPPPWTRPFCRSSSATVLAPRDKSDFSVVKEEYVQNASSKNGECTQENV